MRKSLILLVLLLTSCSALRGTPQPPPAPTAQSQQISREQSSGLPKLGTITTTVRGSPDDAQRDLAAQANRAGATYYQILMISENVVLGSWYGTALLYGPSPTAGTQQ